MPRARATSEEEAANLALVLVREAPIADLAADEIRARTCRTWFATVRDALLEEYDWHFARAATVPGALAGTPTGRFAKRYPLPADCVAVRFVAGLREDQWEVVHGAGDVLVLATDADAPLVHYTARIDEVARWAPQFLHYFAQGLAAAIAPAFGKTFAAAAPSEAPGKRNAFGGERMAQVADAAAAAAQPATEVDAANLALVLVKQPPIGNMAATTIQAAAVRAAFAAVRDLTLRERDWHFATAFAKPTGPTTASAGRFAKLFTLPPDCLDVRHLIGLREDQWAVLAPRDGVTGNAMVLATDVSAPHVCYTARVATVARWDAEFTVRFARRLAEAIAPAFGASFKADDEPQPVPAVPGTPRPVNERRRGYGFDRLGGSADAAPFGSLRVTTEAQAASLALALVKRDAISDLNAPTREAAACRIWFAVARDEVLRDHEWNFAEASLKLVTATAETAGAFALRYPLPTDCVAVRFVADLTADEWAVERGALLTDAPDPVITYTRSDADVATWDPAFVAAFATRLAAYLAPSFDISAAAIERLDEAGERKTAAAARRDAREGASSVITRDTSWIRARRGWR